jgi:hypothetical protein
MSNSKNENEGKFDLSGVFQVQQNYLTDLSDSYPDVNNAPVIAKYVLDLQDKSKEVNTSYQNADTSANAVLTQQNDMIDIVSKEQKRLDEKKFLIDQAEMGEQRKVLLTNSNRLRAAEYTKIILCAVAGLVIHVVLRVIKQKLVEEPSTQNIDSLFIILHIVNILVWTIAMFYIYVNIQARSHINFNQLELPPPSSLMGASTTPATANYNNLFKDLGVCVEESCCGSDTKWDSGSGKCQESFADYSALGDSPKIILPTSEPDTPAEPPKKRADMSDDELRKDIGKQVAKSFEGVNASIDDAVIQAAKSDDLSEYGVADVASLVKVPTADDMSPDMGVKCNISKTSTSDANNFTTMEDYFATKKPKLANVYDARNIQTISPHNENTDLIYSKFSR